MISICHFPGFPKFMHIKRILTQMMRNVNTIEIISFDYIVQLPIILAINFDPSFPNIKTILRLFSSETTEKVFGNIRNMTVKSAIHDLITALDTVVHPLIN